VAQFRRGAEAVKAAAQRKSGGGKFFPVFRWKAGEEKYIQFLMPMDDVLTVLMHKFIIVGQRESGEPQYERFISRRDPMLDGADGYDELIDRFGVTPTERSIILAVEVEPVYAAGSTGRRKEIEGFDLAEIQFEKDGDTVTAPNFGLIEESPKTFFNTLSEYNDSAPIDEVIYAVKRVGDGTDTQYVFIPTDSEVLDVDDELAEFEERFDFDAYLDELADEDRMRELIGPLPDNAKVSRYGGKKRGKGEDTEEEKPKQRRASSRRATRGKTDEEPAEERDFENEDADEKAAGEKKKAPSRSRRFAGLREEAKSKTRGGAA